MVLVSSVRLVARKIEKWFLELMATTANNANMEEMYDEHCTYLPAMVGWFLFSALLNSYNKFVFGQGHLHFPCPLLMTSFHFAIQWMFAAKMCQWYPQETGSDRLNRMTWKEWRSISLPCGMVTSGDIGLSNLSMVTMSITFYTMIKASSPIFVLGFAYLFGIERITWPLLGVMAVIACGEFLTVAGEVDFVMKGFLMCTGASLCSGARWTLVQLKLQTIEPPIKSTIATMRLLAPSMFFTLALTSLVIEKPWNKFHYDPTQDENYDPTVAIDYTAQYRKEILWVFGLGATGGCIAVMMILCEFYLILHSSAVIMMIGGVIKEMTTIVIGYVENKCLSLTLPKCARTLVLTSFFRPSTLCIFCFVLLTSC